MRLHVEPRPLRLARVERHDRQQVFTSHRDMGRRWTDGRETPSAAPFPSPGAVAGAESKAIATHSGGKGKKRLPLSAIAKATPKIRGSYLTCGMTIPKTRGSYLTRGKAIPKTRGSYLTRWMTILKTRDSYLTRGKATPKTRGSYLKRGKAIPKTGHGGVHLPPNATRPTRRGAPHSKEAGPVSAREQRPLSLSAGRMAHEARTTEVDDLGYRFPHWTRKACSRAH